MIRHVPILVVVTVMLRAASGEVLTYEGQVFPELQGWERDGTFDADRSIVEGHLVVDVDFGIWGPDPGGENDAYRHGLNQFVGAPFFLEWRCRTTAPATEIGGVGGAGLNALGGNVSNHLTITSDTIRYIRDNSLPIVFADIEPGSLHVYRIEYHRDQLYRFWIDAVLIDEGIPEGDFPNASARMIWWSRMYLTPSVNTWDYVRTGTLPADASGDFDSDSDVDGRDFRYFRECASNSGIDAVAGPGCRWADMNADNFCDLIDFAHFQRAFTGGDNE